MAYLKNLDDNTTKKEKLLMGYTRDRKAVHFELTPAGSSITLGRPGSGKSVTLKTIISQVKERRILIIDPHSEYEDCQYPNFLSRISAKQDFTIIKDIAIPITQFTTTDLETMGFTYIAAEYLKSYIRQNKEQYANNPKALAKHIKSMDEHDFPSSVSSTINNMKRTMQFLADNNFFYDQTDKRRPLEDRPGNHIAELLQDSNIILDLKMRGASDIKRIRAYVGIILRNLTTLKKEGKTYLSRCKPFIIIDEADKIAPQMEDETAQFSSTSILIEYVLKLRKEGVFIMFATQNYDLMHKNVVENVQSYIIGKLDMGRYKELTTRLRYNPDNDIREFLYIDRNYKHTIFNALEPTCLA